MLRTAGPDRPPVVVASTGRFRSTSMARPVSVFMIAKACAPASATAVATGRMSVNVRRQFDNQRQGTALAHGLRNCAGHGRLGAEVETVGHVRAGYVELKGGYPRYAVQHFGDSNVLFQ